MSCGEQCLSLFLHEGKPSGSFSDFDGTRVYVAHPPNPANSSKAIIIFPDIYGVGLKNTQLIADRFAQETGVSTYLVDLFFGDQAPEPGTDPNFNLQKWFSKHGVNETLPIAEKVLKYLHSKSVTEFGAIGYCLGGKYVFLTSQANQINVGVVCHPSLLENPQDVQKLLEKSKVPMLFNSCETDQQFPPEFQKVTDEILGDGKYKPGYKMNYYAGATHGFACRADLSKPAEKTAFEESFKESVAWFKAHLRLG